MKFRKLQNPNNYIGSLLIHSSGFLAGDFISKSLYILFLPLITILLDPGDFGILSIYLTLLNIISILFRLGIGGSINRIYYDHRDRYKIFLGTNIIFLVSFSAVISVIVQFLFRENISVFFKIPKDLISFALLNAVLLLVFTIYTAHLQATRQSKKYSRIDIFYKATSVVLSVFLMYYLTKEKYMAKVYADLAILILSIGIILRYFASYPIFRISKQEWLYAMRFGLPLLPHALSALILHMFDRVIINQIVGESETGLYSLAYQIGVVLQFVIFGMNRSWITFFYEKVAEKNLDIIKNTFRSYQKIIVSIAVCMILFAGDAVLLLVNDRYHESIGIIIPIIMGYLFLFYNTIYGNYLFYMKKTMMISINSVIATIVNIASNYYFISKYGYMAAAYTTLASFLLLFLLNYVTVRIKFRGAVLPLKNTFPGIIIVGLTVLVLMFIGRINQYYLQLIIKVLIMLAVLSAFFLPALRSAFRSRRRASDN